MEQNSTRFLYVTLLLFTASGLLRAQGNYEIQVYGSETVPAGRTMVELHSNFTVQGFKTADAGVLPDQHQWHETVEITQGWNSWFETGFYIFTSADTRIGYQWVGDHIRPRVRVPDSWHWPVRVSLSSEFGLSTPHLFIRYLDFGDPAYHRQAARSLVSRLQPGSRTILTR